MKRNTFFQDEVIKEKFNLRYLARIIKYVGPHKKTFFLILGLMLAAVALSLIPPMLLRTVVDNVVPDKDMRLFALVFGAFALIAAGDIAITFAHQRIMSKTGHKIIAKIRRDVFEKLQKLPFDFFDARPAGKVVVRVTSYVDELANFFANTLLSFIVNLLRILVVAVFMLALNVKLALIVIAVMVPLGLGVFLIRSRLRVLFRHSRAKDSNRTAYIVESIMGVTVIKSFNRSAKNLEVYGTVQEEALSNWRKIIAVNELNLPVVEGLWNLGMLTLYFSSIALVASGEILTGTVIAFVNYMGMFNGPLTQIAAILQQFAQVSSNLERIFETMDTPVGIEDAENAVAVENPEGKIDFENVTFGYEAGVNVLENFNLSVRAGETIALVGPTGAGKSTVVNLLTRFYDVNDGAVKLDGKDIRDITLNSLRGSIGTLMQDPFVFKDTVMENIRYGKPGASDEECIAAAKRIYADEFIQKLSDGYDTMLAERGEGLSSGEKQLLSFARIILRDPRVLILDEATSSIDTATEEKIQSALNVILADRTAFIVAHRLSTIKRSDRILYIADKGIAEQGSHAELMEQKGRYYALNSQM